MQYDILDIIKEKKSSKFLNFLNEYGKIETLARCAQFLNKRAYVTIDKNGNIKRKKESIILPLVAFFNDTDILIEEFFHSCDIKERQVLDKIERYSNLNIEKIKLNYIKTLFNGNLEFSKRYGKELFLRSKDEFFKISSNFALIGDDNIKPLMVLGLRKLMKDYNENIFYLFIQYMTKYRDNTSIYENTPEYEGNIDELNHLLFSNKKLLDSFEGLQILSSLRLIEDVDITNRKKFLGKIKYTIENKKIYTKLRNTEKKLLEIFL